SLSHDIRGASYQKESGINSNVPLGRPRRLPSLFLRATGLEPTPSSVRSAPASSGRWSATFSTQKKGSVLVVIKTCLRNPPDTVGHPISMQHHCCHCVGSSMLLGPQ